MANIIANATIKVFNEKTSAFDVVHPITKDENVLVGESSNLKEELVKIHESISGKIDSTMINKPNGVAGLDSNGLIPVANVPNSAKEVRVLNNIAERDGIPSDQKFEGLSVLIKDASADDTVTAGAAYYVWDGTAWVKTGETESMDVVLDWTGIEGRPTSTPQDIDAAVGKAHQHTNQAILNKITGDENQEKMLFNGKEIALKEDITGSSITRVSVMSATEPEVGALPNGGIWFQTK